MWYSILFPILIILSLAAVVVFLAKKAPVIRKAREKNVNFEEEKIEKKERFLKRLYTSFFSKIKFLGITLFEFLIKLIKKIISFIPFLKSKKAKKEIEKEDPIIEKIREYENQEDKQKPKKDTFDFEEDEKPVRPMISDKVTTPRNKTEMKDRLEEVLIERIAINPKDVEAYERLGAYYMEISNFLDAKECYRQVMRLDPLNRDAKFKIKRIERELNN